MIFFVGYNKSVYTLGRYCSEAISRFHKMGYAYLCRKLHLFTSLAVYLFILAVDKAIARNFWPSLNSILIPVFT